MWIICSFVAMVGFTISNVFGSIITGQVGPFNIFYFASGSITVCIIELIFNNWFMDKKKWYDWNLTRRDQDGKHRFVKLHIFGILLMTFIYFLDINMVNICMWTAKLANINVGVISVIWSITPLLQAFFDYFVLK